MKKVLILYNKLSDNPTDDESDVLEQIKLVSNALLELDYTVAYLSFDLNLEKTVSDIKDRNPDIIFNLAETVYNKGEFAYLAPSILGYLGIPFTGSPLVPMFNCSNKLLTKRELDRIRILTPNYLTLDKLQKHYHYWFKPDGKYILKPVWEEGSLGLDEHCVFYGSDNEYIESLLKLNKDYFFIEDFIEGRELNVSIIGTKNGPRVLPLAEMKFNYPDDKPKIMGYKSKWIEDSFEYKNTERTFEISDDYRLFPEIEDICKRIWNDLGLKGYVRVDFRLDGTNKPYVIDINLNPCISESGGFYAACLEDGLTYNDMIEKILEEALR
jgi:D-alanine-D-alanine ligase